jgi:uncharacterized protein with PIN domain
VKQGERKMALISLEESDKRVMERLKAFEDGTPNGIACPNCGAELMDINANTLKMSWPAQCDIKCSKCTFKSTRYV